MNTTQVAIYARVSSEQRTEAQTIASQVAALRERVTADGAVVPEAMQFLDDGYSGATLIRPALERLRDVVAAGSVDRLYIHSPDRLARKYAYQVLLVDEFRRAGVEVVFLNRALGQSPEDDLLLQVQGMIAEYERAKIIERHRRGKRHAARAGAVNVLSGAPYGYRYVSKYEGGGQARYDIMPDEARLVRQVFDWVGRDRLTIGEVCRRLTRAGEVTRTGKRVWDRSVVWGMLKHPAYMGTAAFGKTRQEPLHPRLRAQRGRPLQPRRAVSTVDVPQEEWYPIPVPAIVEPEVVVAVQEQLQENRRHARQSRRGALYLLQGLLQCQHCGYAYYGKRLSPSARKGKPRAYAYYRCLGTDAYRFGGERVCQNTQVRTDLLDVAVWQEVCTLLAHPERLAEEYRRRLQPETRAKRTSLATVEAQIGKLRQGVARLIDSYAEGLIDKDEFEPRITRLRQRLARLEEQRQAGADEAALQTELQLIIGRLEDFATKVHSGLETADWASQRDLIRTLVKRVEVARDQVNIVFRVDPYAGDPDPEKKSLQLCRRSEIAEVLQHVKEDDLWIEDRNFCTLGLMFGMARRGATFVVRQHGQLQGELVGHPTRKGTIRSGSVNEQAMLVLSPRHRGPCGCVASRSCSRNLPETGIPSCTSSPNVPIPRASAPQLARLYGKRWSIETAFFEITTTLACEINTLGYPKAALFTFCLALLAYNAVSLIKAALRSAHGRQKINDEGLKLLSGLGDWPHLRRHDDCDSLAALDAFRERSDQEFANVLGELASSVNLSRYQKHPRGPKKKPPERTAYQNGKHVSTAKNSWHKDDHIERAALWDYGPSSLAYACIRFNHL